MKKQQAYYTLALYLKFKPITVKQAEEQAKKVGRMFKVSTW